MGTVVSTGISTHSAREDGDTIEDQLRNGTDISTHSAREDGDATYDCKEHDMEYFNPLRPRGRRPYPIMYDWEYASISTHSAREDGDGSMDYFSSTGSQISTHSAREDGDE